MNTFQTLMPRSGIILILIALLYSVTGYAGTGQYFRGNGGYGEIADAGFADLDYTKDFSIEAVVDIGIDENANTWMGVLTKAPNNGMYTLLPVGAYPFHSPTSFTAKSTQRSEMALSLYRRSRLR